MYITCTLYVLFIYMAQKCQQAKCICYAHEGQLFCMYAGYFPYIGTKSPIDAYMNDMDFYTVEQAAEKLNVSDRYIRDQISKGSLKAFKRGKRHYIFHSDLVSFIRSEG